MPNITRTAFIVGVMALCIQCGSAVKEQKQRLRFVLFEMYLANALVDPSLEYGIGPDPNVLIEARKQVRELGEDVRNLPQSPSGMPELKPDIVDLLIALEALLNYCQPSKVYTAAEKQVITMLRGSFASKYRRLDMLIGE